MPSEISAYYQAHKKEITSAPQAHVFQILIRAKEGSPTAAYQEAIQILRRLKSGEDFQQLAKSSSQGPYADKGGDIGWVNKGDLATELDRVVFGLQSGEISEVVRSNLGCHIFKVEEIKPGREMTLSESQSIIKEFLWNRKFQEELLKYIAELKKNAYICYK